MSEAAVQQQGTHGTHEAAHDDEHHIDYVSVWRNLLILLAISVIGPMFEIPWLTLVTAFGIAIVKAYLVAKNFMHVNIEPKYILYLLTVMLLFMFVFVAGVSPDVLRHEGRNWQNTAAQQEVQRALSESEGGGGHH